MALKEFKHRIIWLLKYNPGLSTFYIWIKSVILILNNRIYSDKKFIKKLFKKYQGYELDLKKPVTLNEKLQWLKLNDRKEIYTKMADKYAARDFIRDRFGENYLIPLLYKTDNYKDLIPENLPEAPFVIKTNHGFGNSTIIRNKSQIKWQEVLMDYKRWMKNNYYYFEREWQYKNIKPLIIIEKLLLDKEGNLPNDYKLNFIEGQLEFIYVSVDREGSNKRNIYTKDWKPINFTWARKGKNLSSLRGEEIVPPPTIDKMIAFGTEFAKLSKYLRVDFYDVDGKLYFGELTHCHGGGFDQMRPFSFDQALGRKINLWED
jgi:hypothetical protein